MLILWNYFIQYNSNLLFLFSSKFAICESGEWKNTLYNVYLMTYSNHWWDHDMTDCLLAGVTLHRGKKTGRKEGNVLFNDALNTFYLRLYGIGHMVREETCCRHMGYSFQLTARVLLYAPSHRQGSTYHSLYYTSRGALAGTRNSSMGPPHEGSIRRPIAPWVNALTTELHLAPKKTETHPWGVALETNPGWNLCPDCVVGIGYGSVAGEHQDVQQRGQTAMTHWPLGYAIP